MDKYEKAQIELDYLRKRSLKPFNGANKIEQYESAILAVKSIVSYHGKKRDTGYKIISDIKNKIESSKANRASLTYIEGLQRSLSVVEKIF